MAEQAQLIAVMSARLDKFEAQMKRAGVIADDAVRDIEGRFSRANPQFGGTFLGSFLGTLSAQLSRGLIEFLQQIPEQLRAIESAAEAAGISLERAFALGLASGDIAGTAKLLENIAKQLERMRQGDPNQPLLKLFEANDITNITNANQAIESLAGLMERATAAQRLLIADSLGLSREQVEFLSRGAAAIREQQAAAEAANPQLRALAELAKIFEENWRASINFIRSLFIDMVQAAASAIAPLARGLANAMAAVNAPGVALIERAATAWERIGRQITVGPKEGQTGVRIPVGAGGGGEGFNRFDREEQRINRQIKLLEAETATIGLNTFAREKMRIEAQLMDSAQRAGIPITEELRSRIDGLSTSYATAAQAADTARQRFEAVVHASQQVGQALATAFGQAIIEGKKLNEVMGQLVRTLANAALQSAFSGLFGAQGIGGIFGRLFARQHGGPVLPGNAYIVGERGPELFVPNVAGNVMANGAGGTSITYAPIVDARGADSGAIARLERVMAEDRRMFSAKVVTAVTEARRRSVRI